LGEALRGAWRSRVEVITKLDPLDALPNDAEESAVRAAVDGSVRRSCEVLRTEQLSTVLLHRADHYRAWRGAAWRRLLEMREEGTIGVLGASVYDPQEALELLWDPAIQHLQIPMNVLDWRWKACGVDRAVAQRPEVVVHARSALLQGLLTGVEVPSWPELADFDSASSLRQLRN